MAKIYKIGKGYYESNLGNKDKNSGLFETDLISKEVRNMSDDLVIIINGAIQEKDEIEIKLLLSKHCKKIFILSDLQCLNSCLWVINRCDVLLHQVPHERFKFKTIDKHVKQMYGYVPELFFRFSEPSPYKHDLVLFGGNDFEREDDIKNIIFHNGKIRPYFLLLYKSYKDNIDNRLDYSEYIKLLSMMKYSLIIARKEYYDIGWVTSRIVEAFDNRVLPIVDYRYDKFEHFIYGANILLPSNECFSIEIFIKNIINENFYNNFTSQQLIEENRDIIANNRHKFKELIYNV